MSAHPLARHLSTHTPMPCPSPPRMQPSPSIPRTKAFQIGNTSPRLPSSQLALSHAATTMLQTWTRVLSTSQMSMCPHTLPKSRQGKHPPATTTTKHPLSATPSRVSLVTHSRPQCSHLLQRRTELLRRLGPRTKVPTHNQMCTNIHMASKLCQCPAQVRLTLERALELTSKT